MSDIAPLQQEIELINPPAQFEDQANIAGMAAYRAHCAAAEADYEGFWARHARDCISWHRPFTRTLNEDHAPFYRWFDVAPVWCSS